MTRRVTFLVRRSPCVRTLVLALLAPARRPLQRRSIMELLCVCALVCVVVGACVLC